MANRLTNRSKTLVIKGIGGKEQFSENRNPPRQCRICGGEIPIIRDRHGIVVFNSYFHCPKKACQKAWDYRTSLE